jgi:hypothetical protein
MNSLATFFARGRKLDDWLSPILVKELRQGMRARAFVLSFLLIQVFLIVLVLGNLAAEGDRNALNFQTGLFWVIIGFALLLLMPLRGLVAISQETKNHTMETIMLTRLTAWRVVAGKWSALFAQSLLFVSAVLPYVVLRYFIGGDDVVADFELLLFMLWLSGLLIAASIALSASGNVIVRIILVVAGFCLIVGWGNDIIATGFSGGFSGDILGWYFLFGIFIPVLLFEFTASGIAPKSENHAFRRRVLAVSLFSLAALFDWVTDDSFDSGVLIALIVVVGICYFELSEKPRLLVRLVQPLARRNWLGRIVGLFLLPGWPSGLLFSLVAIPAAVLVTAHFAASSLYSPLPLVVWAIFGSALIPVLICHLFWSKMKQVALMIVLYNMFLFGVAAILKDFADLIHWNIDQVLAFVPGLPVLLTNIEGTSSESFISVLTLIVVVLVLLATSRRYFRDLSALIRSGSNSRTSSGEEKRGAPTP